MQCVCVCGVVGALMIFPGQAEVGVQVYIYVCLCVCADGKKGGGYMGNMASFLNISPDSSFGFVCLIDCLGALSLC